METNPNPSPLLAPPTRLALAPDLLEPRGLADWLMCPWMSEKLQGLILPLDLEGLRVLMAWDGIATLRLREDGALRLAGRTGAFGSLLTTTRAGGTTTLQGFRDDQTVDYAVVEEGNEIRVEGDTGRFRSLYTIRFSEAEAFLAGDHGQYNSHYTARCFGNLATLEGVRGGERIELRIEREGSSLRLSGFLQGSEANLALTCMSDRDWLLSGFLFGETANLAIRLVEDGVHFVGAVPGVGSANYKLFRTGEGLLVRGKTDSHHLNYRLITHPAGFEAVGPVVGEPALPEGG